MELGKLLTRWWFVALLSLAIGMPLSYLVLDIVFDGIAVLGTENSCSNLPLLVILYLPLSGYLILFICVLLTMAPRHAIAGMVFPAPGALVKQGREVMARRGSYDIRVAKFSIIRVYEEDGTFRCLPTSTGLWGIVLLSLGPQLVIFAFPFLLYINEKCWRSLKGLTLQEKAPVEAEKGIEEMTKDSLMRAYMLAREAADIRRASFQDHAIILVAFSLLAWAALVALSAPIIVDHGSPWWFSMGTAAIAAVAVSSLLILWRRSRRLVAKEEEWAQRLYSAMEGIGTGSSPIEVLLDACHEVPRWLSLHRKGIWTREPGKTLLSFILMVAGSNGLMQYGSIWWGFLPLSIGLLAIGLSIFLYMVITAGTENRDLASEWDDRMKEMCSLLEPAGRD